MFLAYNRGMDVEKEKISKYDLVFPMSSFWRGKIEVMPNLYVGEGVDLKGLRNPILLLTGFSGSGKDTVLKSFLGDGSLRHIVTAVNRERAEGEPENAYVWMRKQEEGEDFGEYYDSLVEEYGLIEHDAHYGNVYGLPKSSLSVDLGGSVPVVRTDIKGVITLRGILPSMGYSPVSLAIMPESWLQVFNSLLARGRDDFASVQKRFEEDWEKKSLYLKYIDVFLLNSRSVVNGKSGLDVSVDGLRYLVNLLRGSK